MLSFFAAVFVAAGVAGFTVVVVVVVVGVVVVGGAYEGKATIDVVVASVGAAGAYWGAYCGGAGDSAGAEATYDIVGAVYSTGAEYVVGAGATYDIVGAAYVTGAGAE